MKTAGIQTFHDYRQMFDKIHKQIDAVFVAAPDHHHAAASLAAMKLGKHVYCEKPLAHSIGEVRLMMETARKRKVMTQLGNQGHSDDYIRLLCEYLWAGAIGEVTEVYAWAPTGRGGTGGRLPTKPVPAGLHWDEWIGPMPYRDYHDELHPLQWRSWWQFGDGSVGDWGCHNLDGPFMALRLGAAHERRGRRAFRRLRRAVPAAQHDPLGLPRPRRHAAGEGLLVRRLLRRHPLVGARREASNFKQNRPPIVAELEAKYKRDLRTGGTIYVGTKGIMHTGNYCRQPADHPRGKNEGVPRAEADVAPRGQGPQGTAQASGRLPPRLQGRQAAKREFRLRRPALRDGAAGLPGRTGGRGQESRVGRRPNEVTNLPELNRLVHREYRPGWGL